MICELICFQMQLNRFEQFFSNWLLNEYICGEIHKVTKYLSGTIFTKKSIEMILKLLNPSGLFFSDVKLFKATLQVLYSTIFYDSFAR